MIYILTDGILNQKMVKKENPVQLLDLVVKHEGSKKKWSFMLEFLIINIHEKSKISTPKF